MKAGKEPERKKQERKPPSAKEQRAEEEIDRKMAELEHTWGVS